MGGEKREEFRIELEQLKETYKLYDKARQETMEEAKNWPSKGITDLIFMKYDQLREIGQSLEKRKTRLSELQEEIQKLQVTIQGDEKFLDNVHKDIDELIRIGHEREVKE